MRVAILLGIFVIASRSWADSLEADFEGTFASTGSNFGRDTSYVVGDFDYYYRDYFAFDLSAVTAHIASARLRLWTPYSHTEAGNRFGFQGPDAAETFVMSGVATATTGFLVSYGHGDSTGQSIWADLGDGPVLGSRAIGPSTINEVLDIEFDAAGLVALNAARGGTIVIGGYISTLSGASVEGLFAGTGEFIRARDGGTDPVLEFDTSVPEPRVLLLLAISIGGAIAARRRSKGTDPQV